MHVSARTHKHTQPYLLQSPKPCVAMERERLAIRKRPRAKVSKKKNTGRLSDSGHLGASGISHFDV